MRSLRDATDGSPRTTATSLRRSRVALATTLKPDSQMKPVFMPSAPGKLTRRLLWVRMVFLPTCTWANEKRSACSGNSTIMARAQNCRVQGVETWRSRRKDHGHLPPTPQLPGPPKLKLLPAPSAKAPHDRPQPTKPNPPPDKGKRPWTADQLRLALQGEDPVRAKFSKPIPYPKRCWP